MSNDDRPRPFAPEQFVPIEGHALAEEKAEWANHFARFVEGGFRQDHLTKRFYSHLHCLWGFIAHYDRWGFYGYFFDRRTNCRCGACGCASRVRAEGLAAFVATILLSPCYGAPDHTWSDVETVVASWLRGWLLGHDRPALAAFMLEYRAYEDGPAVDAWEVWLVARMEALLTGQLPPAAPRRIDAGSLGALRRPIPRPWDGDDARGGGPSPARRGIGRADSPGADIDHSRADTAGEAPLPLFADVAVSTWARPVCDA